jgi:DNA-binding IscR family transcriptional regulator
MNARAMEPSAIHEFIFGDQQLHARFAMAIEVLARIMIASPRPMTTVALSESLGQSVRTMRLLLSSLHQAGLVCQDEKTRDAWFFSSARGTITLADIFRSVSGATPEPRRKKCEPQSADGSRTASQQSVDLLLMQATMAINQVVLQHLQAFDIGRLKAVGSSASFHHFNSSVRSYIAEPV